MSIHQERATVIAYFKGYNKYKKNLSKADKKTLNAVYNEYLAGLREDAATTKERRINNVKFSLKGINEWVFNSLYIYFYEKQT